MKRKYVLIVLLFLFEIGNGQSYFPLPDSNATWLLDYQDIFCWEDNIRSRYQYKITGDVVIDSMVYHKIERSGEFWCNNWPGGGYLGVFRNDTSARKVYIIPVGDTTEVVLYDFTLKIGDTIKGYFNNMYGDTAIIVDIDSILIDSVYRRQWHYIPLTYPIDNYIIEGIGSLTGLLDPLTLGFEVGWGIRCFSQNGRTLYPGTKEEPCEFSVSVEELNEEPFSSVILSPNPTNDILLIQSPIALGSITIYNMIGEVVLAKKLDGANQIDVGDLNVGMYVVSLTNKDFNGIVRRKLLISN